MRGTHLARIPIILFLLLEAQNQFSGYSNPQKNQKPLQHEVTVTLKLVQVYVTDRDGNSIMDLAKDDFILYDNGKLQTITDFERHLLIRPEKKVEEEIIKTQLPPSEDISSLMNRKFFLFLDLDRNTLDGVNKSKRAALHFIDTQLKPTDEVGVLSYSLIKGLVVHLYLTSDHEKAKQAVNGIKFTPGIIREVRFDPKRRNIVTHTGGFAGTNNFIVTIKELAKALRYIDGYKNIILFSEGIEYGWLFSSDQLLGESYEEMCKELTTSNTLVHTVNTIPIDIDIPQSIREPALKMLSELSGGRYFNDASNPEKIATQIQNVTGNYYVLGYYINEKWDGRYHKIKVEVKRKGYIVQAQGGYFNPKPFSELSKFEKDLQIIDLALSKGRYYETPFPFPLMALPCPVEGKPGLILLSEIQVDELEEIIGKETEIVTLIFDQENNIVNSTQGKANLTSIPQKLLHHYAIYSLEPGDYECRVILRNLETGRSARGASAARVLDVKKSEIFIYPPFIMIPDTPCFYIKASKTEKEQKPVHTISLNDIYPFLASNHSPLVHEIEGDVHRLLSVLKFSIRDVTNPELDFSVGLVHQSTGEIIPLNFFLHDSWRVGIEDALLLELRLPEMEPGQYELEFFIKCYEPNMEASVKRGFRVR